ncbi:MAG TPA: bifunctional pyr operon transcriptional regulator/uracil phosphoribosyltransferase PyrR [Opitutus sp.]|nr:bifunctional pyr operon transcriptional regulator/uracil phosphoribosyltransferase PyrR [Opitutus sp.]
MAQSKIIGAGEIHTAIEQLATAIIERHGPASRLLVLGIANGGIEVARRLIARLTAIEPQLGVLEGTIDISFHRDDISSNPIPKEFAHTHIASDVNGATVILVDDVLYSGRTVKAALNELFDHGRPTKVELVILVDRGGRRLPVAADYCGLTVTASETEKVVVSLNRDQPERDQIRIEPSINRNAAI